MSNVVRIERGKDGERARFVPVADAPGGASEGTDADLVRRARGGDEAALEALFRRHLTATRGFAYRLLGQERDLEDLVQEAFLVALSDLAKLREPELFGAWLRGIVVRLARTRLRRRRLLRSLGLWSSRDDAHLVAISQGAPPDIAAELRAVYAVIQRLPPDTRMALVLSRVEELSVGEVASALAVSLSTAKRLLTRAEYELEIELGRGRMP